MYVHGLQLEQLRQEFSQQPPNLQYPSYYTVPFHSYDDGNLNWQVRLFANPACPWLLVPCSVICGGLMLSSVSSTAHRHKLCPASVLCWTLGHLQAALVALQVARSYQDKLQWRNVPTSTGRWGTCIQQDELQWFN
jgi:hypothetical protein